MSTTTSAFDSKLRELELETMPPIDQMDLHWRLLRDQLITPTTQANKPFYKNPFLYWTVITIVTVGAFLLFKFMPTTDITNTNPTIKDSSTSPSHQNVIYQDTLPTKKVETRTTKKYPAKRVSTSAIKKDSITLESTPENSRKLPVKKIYGISTRSTSSNKKDTIKIDQLLIDKKSVQDTFYFQPVKQVATSSNREFNSKTDYASIHITNGDTSSVYTKNNSQDPIISVAENSLTAKTEVKYYDYIIVEDTNRFQNLEQILKNPYFKEKVVYIDLWGTRCAPCIEEFKHSEELKDKYRGKDLVFLYLKSPYSFDDSKEWNMMIYKYHLSGMNVSMSIGFYTEQFWNKYSQFYSEERLFGIPTYMIVNKQGKIVDYDAPRPSSGAVLFEKLDKELAN